MVRPSGLSTIIREVLARPSAPPLRSSGNALARNAHPAIRRPAQPGASRTASTTTNPDVFRTAARFFSSFVGSIESGVFRSFKAGYAKSLSNSASSRFTDSGVNSLRSSRFYKPRTGSFGPRPQPIKPTFSAHNVGLSSARNFSTGYFALDNVVSNVPLALRMVVNGQFELDRHKWRKVVRQTREAHKSALKTRVIPAAAPGQGMLQAREQFFPTAGNVWATQAAESVQERSPVTLVVPLEPDLVMQLLNDVAPRRQYNDGEDFRIVTPLVLNTIRDIVAAYEDGGHRLRSLLNKLERSGVTDADVTKEANFLKDGQKELHLIFGPSWTRQDVAAALDDWGERPQWYRIIGGEDEHHSSPSSSMENASNHSPAFSSALVSLEHSDHSFEDELLSEIDIHDQVASTLFLPTIATTASPPSEIDEDDPWDLQSFTSDRNGQDGATVLAHDGSDSSGSYLESASTVWENPSDSLIQHNEDVMNLLVDIDARQREREYATAT